MEEKKKWLYLGSFAAVLYLAVTRIDNIVDFVKLLAGAASPLLLGAVIAYVLNILLKQAEKFYFPGSRSLLAEKTRRPVCILLCIAFVILVVVLILKLVVPELISSFVLIGKEIPVVFEDIRIWLVNNSEGMPSIQEMLQGLNINWPEFLQKLAGYVTAGATGVIVSTVAIITGTLGVITQALIGTIFAIYLLFNKEKLYLQVKKLLTAFLPQKALDKLRYNFRIANETFTNFIVGQFTEAVIIGSLCTLGMTLLRFPYAGMTGAVVGATALIPVVGAYIGAFIGAFMIFTVNPLKAVFFILFLVILQQLEGNLIYPKVVGSSIGLPGMWVLAAVTIGGGTLGIAGMLLGVPLAATVYKLLGNEVNRRLQKNKKTVKGK